MATAAQRRQYVGPALFSFGFRPFFLGAAIWAALAVLLWLPEYFGELQLPTAFGPLDWHIHEMLYGYVPAVMTGFLLTAIPNWTGRLPVQGSPLVWLAALWLAGRIAVMFSAKIGAVAAGVIDVAFLVGLCAFAAREIVAGKNWRNLRVLVLVVLLAIGNAIFHIEALKTGAADLGMRVGLVAAIGLIMLIGGRIVPSFTHNWLARQAPGRMPIGFSRFDAVSLAVAALSMAAWLIAPLHWSTGLALLLAGLLQIARLARWAGDRTFSDRLVLILHVAYAFVPLGFLMLGASILWPGAVPRSASVHAWTAGAIGLMTLAMMTRASLGHTGQALRATTSTQVIYGLALISALARIAAAFIPSTALLHTAALIWAAAFATFAIAYGPALVRPRKL